MKIRYHSTLCVLMCATISLLTACSKSERNVAVSDTNITVGEITRAIDLVNIHSSKQKFVEVAGKRYVDLRGNRPYYLSIPEKDSIIFVTEESNHQSTIHVVNLKSHEHFSIKDAGSLGRGIGSTKPKGSPFTDWIGEVAGNRVAVVSRGDESEEVIVIDFDSKRLAHSESDYFDGTGVLTNREIRLNGGWKPKEAR